jgi:hypothetical protein
MTPDGPDMRDAIGLLSAAVVALKSCAGESVSAANEMAREARAALSIRGWHGVHVLPGGGPSAPGVNPASTQIKEG